MEVDHHQQSPSQTIMAALSTLTPTQFSDLIHPLSSDFHLQNHRLQSLLSSPIRFSLTLQYLQSLSLQNKTLLIARHLLKTLKQLTIIWETKTHTSLNTTNIGSMSRIRLRDADAISLLLLLCEVHQYNSKLLLTHPQVEWRRILNNYAFNNTLMTISGMGFSITSLVLCPYIDIVIKCRRFVDAMNASGGKMSKEVAASAAAVVALPSVQVHNGGVECVICKEEMGEGRDVCEMPCEHLFHWICILPWLKKRNTCPCCRFQIPTEDIFGEIDRLWTVLITKSAGCSSIGREGICVGNCEVDQLLELGWV